MSRNLILVIIILFFNLCYTHAQSRYEQAFNSFKIVSEDSTKKDSALYYVMMAKQYAEQDSGKLSMAYLKQWHNVAWCYRDLYKSDTAFFIWMKMYETIKNLDSYKYAYIKWLVYDGLMLEYVSNRKNEDSAYFFAKQYLAACNEYRTGNSLFLLNDIAEVAWNFDVGLSDEHANEFYKKCLVMRKKLFGAKDAEFTAKLDSLCKKTLRKSSAYIRYVVYKTSGTLSRDKYEELLEKAAGNGSSWDNLQYSLALKDKAISQFGDSSEKYYDGLAYISYAFLKFSGMDSLAVFPLQYALYDLKGHSEVNSFNYGDVLFNLAGIYERQENFLHAVDLYKMALSNYKNKVGKESFAYANTLQKLAFATMQSDYKKWDDNSFYIDALAKIDTAVEIAKEVCGDENIDYLRIKKQHSNFLLMCARQKEAEPELLELYNLYTKYASSEKDEILGVIHLIYMNYIYMYDNAKALPWIDKYITYAKSKNYFYGNALADLGDIYMDVNPDKAKNVLDEFELLYQQKDDSTSSGYYEHLLKKALFKIQAGHFSEAGNILLTSIKGLRQLPLDKGMYRTLIEAYQKLPEVFMKQNLWDSVYSSANELYQLLKADDLEESEVAEDAYRYLSEYFLQKNQSDSALFFSSKALQSIANTHSKQFANYFIAQSNLACVYWRIHQTKKADSLLQEACNNLIKIITKNFAGFSERERKTYSATLTECLQKYYSLHQEMYKSNPYTTTIAYNYNLQMKGLLLNSTISEDNEVLQSPDSTLKAAYLKLKNLKNNMVKRYQQNRIDTSNQKNVTDSLEDEISKLERYLSSNSKSFSDFEERNKFGFTQVRDKLNNDEAAIEFISFPYFNGASFTDSTINAAFILKKNSKSPEYIVLESNLKLLPFITNQGTEGRGAIVDIKTSVNSYKYLFNTVWQPLLPFLSGIKTVYIAPDGLLNKVSFDALQDSNGKYLIDRYNIHSLLSSKDIINNNDDAIVNLNITLFGGAQFDNFIATNAIDTLTGTRSLPYNLRGGSTWKYLPGTLSEVTSISALLKSDHWHVATFTGNEASEKNFKYGAWDSAKQILHIATHGFYFQPDSSDKNFTSENIYESSKDPLLRSGIVFSGANKAWLGNNVAANEEDGILTAYELSTIDLSKVQLVVLSACETGIGEIENGEGVFGLQRALKQAGVSKMIVSLWSVPDRETSEMMLQFYKSLANQKNIAVAFKTAQSYMRNKYPQQPALWAGFTLVE